MEELAPLDGVDMPEASPADTYDGAADVAQLEIRSDLEEEGTSYPRESVLEFDPAREVPSAGTALQLTASLAELSF